jgi:hypothetical protein
MLSCPSGTYFSDENGFCTLEMPGDHCANNMDSEALFDMMMAPANLVPATTQSQDSIYVMRYPLPASTRPPAAQPAMVPLFFDQKRRSVVANEFFAQPRHQIFYVPVAFVNPPFEEMDDLEEEPADAIDSFISYLINTVGAVPAA